VEGRGRTGKGEGRKGRKGEAEVGERSSIHQLCGVAAHSVELHFEVSTFDLSTSNALSITIVIIYYIGRR